MAYSHYTGMGQGMGLGPMDPYSTEKFSLVQDRERNQDSLSPIVLVQFPVPVAFPFPISVNKP